MGSARSATALVASAFLVACNALLGNEEGELSLAGSGGADAGPPCVGALDAEKTDPLGGLGLVTQAKSQLVSGTASVTNLAWTGVVGEVVVSGALSGTFPLPSGSLAATGHYVAALDLTKDLLLTRGREVPGPGMVLPSRVSSDLFYLAEFAGTFSFDGQPMQADGTGKNVALVKLDGDWKLLTMHYLPLGIDGTLLGWRAGATNDAPVLALHVQDPGAERTQILRYNAALDLVMTLGVTDGVESLNDLSVWEQDGTVAMALTPEKTMWVNGAGSEELDDPAKAGVVVVAKGQELRYSVLHGLGAEHVAHTPYNTYVAGRVLTPATTLVVAGKEYAHCGSTGSHYVASLGPQGKPDFLRTFSGVEQILELGRALNDVAVLARVTGDLEFGGKIVPAKPGLALIVVDVGGNFRWLQTLPGLNEARLDYTGDAFALFGAFQGALDLGAKQLSAAGPAADFVALFSVDP